MKEPRPARLSPRDVLRTGASGMRARPGRVVLSALGIAIGIATMISVVGIAASAQAKVLRELARLGSDMLVVTPGADLLTGRPVPLPEDAAGRVARIPGVEQVAATAALRLSVRRSEKISAAINGGITVQAAAPSLAATVRATVRAGTWFNPATSTLPTVVLGDVAAQRLGVTEAGQQVYLADRYYVVLGILAGLPLSPEIARSALVGWEHAREQLGFDGRPTTVYERSVPERVRAIHEVLPRSVDPETPRNVEVSDPAAAWAARAATEGALDDLVLGLGAVALLIGGVGVANTMVVSVLQRRTEIGLRRSLGATRGQIRLQFLTESLLLSALGGLGGAALGAAAVGAYAVAGAMPWTVPPWAIAGGLGATLVIGAVAGLYPAFRAARVSPTTALHSF